MPYTFAATRYAELDPRGGATIVGANCAMFSWMWVYPTSVPGTFMTFWNTPAGAGTAAAFVETFLTGGFNEVRVQVARATTSYTNRTTGFNLVANKWQLVASLIVVDGSAPTSYIWTADETTPPVEWAYTLAAGSGAVSGNQRLVMGAFDTAAANAFLGDIGDSGWIYTETTTGPSSWFGMTLTQLATTAGKLAVYNRLVVPIYNGDYSAIEQGKSRDSEFNGLLFTETFQNGAIASGWGGAAMTINPPLTASSGIAFSTRGAPRPQQRGRFPRPQAATRQGRRRR